jgi:hypothetical protein
MSGTVRDLAALVALALGAFGLERRGRSDAASDRDAPSNRNIILVVSDGLRWQEVLRGADSLLLFSRAGGSDAGARQRFWRPTVAERRAALMPFVWNTIARQGQVRGNRDLGSRVSVANTMKFSYPGYNELLVGYPDPRIDNNEYGPNPNVTVFEWLNRRKELKGRVAIVGAWETFADIFNSRRSKLRMFAGKTEPLDARAHTAAMRFLKEAHPRALFVAYVETDDAAHKGDYARTLGVAHRVDSYLAELWAAVQADPRYRDRTTLIFTADHGRGRTSRDWTDHGPEIDGSEETWVAMMGPGIPARGEARGGSNVNAQIAATVAASLRLDYQKAASRAAPSIIPIR